LQGVAAEGKETKLRLADCKARAEVVRADRLAIAKLQTRLGQLEQHQNRILENLKDLPARQRRLDIHNQCLVKKDYAQAEQERRLKVAAELEKYERVAQQRKDVHSDLEKYKDVGIEMERLRKAEEEMEFAPVRLEELTERVHKKEEQLAKTARKIEEIRTRTAELPQLYREQAALAQQMQSAENDVLSATRNIGELTRELELCQRFAEERVRKEAERLQASREKDQYKELTAAFSDKGVQALIIGNALPELQNQTNELLSRMTNGAMQVQLLLQREAKTKGANPIETLDIIISDEMGSRPYEMYSGGEAFRINFALRVALSKLLAHRAGAPLQTLILDEGFGTQDPRGREAIADAIHAVADDFAVVLVITHIEELKETFPTRIEVVKGAGGSTFSVV
jgi:exonuclease SbcC